jgi:hypothetical protein
MCYALLIRAEPRARAAPIFVRHASAQTLSESHRFAPPSQGRGRRRGRRWRRVPTNKKTRNPMIAIPSGRSAATTKPAQPSQRGRTP